MNARHDDGPGIRVRPYAITGGRTRGKVDIAIETTIVPTQLGRDKAETMRMEPGRILRLCTRPLSVAEISAHLHVPLGVARVLVGDMVDEGLVDFNRSAIKGERPSLRLLERVFDGLQAL